ncbi:uncharacterized protein LOC113865508 [Abrus precatorius]|uniref:Uncharacterized protein LOC113865508 n=1 Tax=Abrus precatorius TaxID=3816 RepID=A0A8B8LI44_ABRPR|nr:uncharacterized protein LOC113865508 [Abrus precatorius]
MKQEHEHEHQHQHQHESEVAQILIKLPNLIWESECGHGILPLKWGGKRKRSTIAVTIKREASSPATPFSFSPSESDDNPTTLFTANLSLKTKREHYLRIIEQLTKDNALLCREVKNVKCYFDKLKEFNLKLKARKQELCLGPNQTHLLQQQLQFTAMPHLPPFMGNHTAGAPLITEAERVVRQPCGHATTSSGAPSNSGGAMGLGHCNSNNEVGPNGIPDLNLPLDESMTMECCEASDVNVKKDLSRAVAAQARKNRLQIYRLKNPFGNSKTRFSCR